MLKMKTIIITYLFLLLIISIDPSFASSAFMASSGNNVLVGQNSDGEQEGYMYLFFHPPSVGKHGYFVIRFDNSYNLNEKLVNHAGMNDQGLVIAPTSIPSRELTLHPEKSRLNDTYVNTLLSTVSTVEQAIAVLEQYQPHDPDFSDFHWQLLITDKTGDAVSISVGPDNEFHFSRKEDKFKVIMNFNIAEPSLGRYPDPRYDIATNKLGSIDSEEDVSVEHFQSVLDAIHWEGFETNSIYSNIYDPVNGLIYLYYFHQFEEVVVLDLDEELAKGYHYYNYQELFSQDIVEKAALEKQENIRLYNGIILLFLIFIVVFIVLLGFTIYKTGKKVNLTTKRKGLRIGAILASGLLGISILNMNGGYFVLLMSSNYTRVSDSLQPFIRSVYTIDLLVIGCTLVFSLFFFTRKYAFLKDDSEKKMED